MKSKRQLLSARRPINKLALGLSAAMVAIVGVMLLLISFAGTSSQLYLSPASGTHSVGANVSVELRMNSGSVGVNAVEAYLNYRPDQLQFVSMSDEGGVFNFSSPSSGNSNGVVTVSRGRVGSATGDQKIVTVTFKTLKAGTANIALGQNSVLLRTSDSQNIVTSVSGSSLNIGSGTVAPSPGTGGKFYLDPASSSYAVGTNMTVQVKMDSGSVPVNAARVRLQFPADKLSFVGADFTGSPMTVGPKVAVSSGLVEINRGATSPATGTQQFASVTFAVKAAGSAPIGFATGSVLLRSSDSTNIASVFNGGTYSLASSVAAPEVPPATPPAAGGALYLKPGSGSFPVGQNFSVEVRMNAGSESVNAAGVRLQYPVDKLTYVGTSFDGSPFAIGPEVSVSGGVVDISRATIGSSSGDQIVAKVAFSPKVTGSAALTFGNGSVILRRSDSSNIAKTFTGGNYTLTAAGSEPSTPSDPTAGTPDNGGGFDDIIDIITDPFTPDEEVGVTPNPDGTLPDVGTDGSVPRAFTSLGANGALLGILISLVVLGLIGGATGLILHRNARIAAETPSRPNYTVPVGTVPPAARPGATPPPPVTPVNPAAQGIIYPANASGDSSEIQK